MRYRLMDLLACPICKTFPLQLIVLQEDERNVVKETDKPLCELYCGLHRKDTKEFDANTLAQDCRSCFSHEVSEGALLCPSCTRWYPIIEEIPHMLPDDLRDEKEDLQFLEKYRSSLPETTVLAGKPFHLES